MPTGEILEVDGLDEFIKDMNRLDVTLRLVAEKEIIRAAKLLERRVKKDYSGPVLNPRSGHLRRSVTTRFKKAGFRTWAIVGTPVRYARIQEKGGTIRPTGRSAGRTYVVGRRRDGTIITRQSKGRKLTIPFSRGPAASMSAQTAQAGVSRGQFMDQIALLLSRGQPFRTFVRGNVLMIGIGLGSSHQTFPLAVLKDQVTLRPRPTWGPRTRQVRKLIFQRLQKVMQKEINSQGAGP